MSVGEASLYGWRWQQARLRFLCTHPLCVMCAELGRVEAANVVDHAIPHKGDPGLFWDERNWQALCKACHDSRKQMLESGDKIPPHASWNHRGECER